jgi:hypothetical protein
VSSLHVNALEKVGSLGHVSREPLADCSDSRHSWVRLWQAAQSVLTGFNEGALTFAPTFKLNKTKNDALQVDVAKGILTQRIIISSAQKRSPKSLG